MNTHATLFRAVTTLASAASSWCTAVLADTRTAMWRAVSPACTQVTWGVTQAMRQLCLLRRGVHCLLRELTPHLISAHYSCHTCGTKVFLSFEIPPGDRGDVYGCYGERQPSPPIWDTSISREDNKDALQFRHPTLQPGAGMNSRPAMHQQIKTQDKYASTMLYLLNQFTSHLPHHAR